MPKLKVYDISGNEVGEVEVSDELFASDINVAAMHMMVRAHLNKIRQGSKSTLTRSEVRGGGRKPYRQKGTGRARQGSTRAPQWYKGGVVFAPKPRDFSISVTKNLRRLALKSALSSKFSQGEIIVLDNLDLQVAKTKEMIKVLSALNAKGKSLLVMPARNSQVEQASGNLQQVHTLLADKINVYDILNHDNFIVTKDALDIIQEVYI